MRPIIIFVALMAAPAFGLPAIQNGNFSAGNANWTEYGSGGFINGAVTSDVGGYPATFPLDGNYGATAFWNDANGSGTGSRGRYQIVDVTGYVGQMLTLEVMIHWHNHGLQYTWHEWGVIDGTDTDPNSLPGTGVWMEKRIETDDTYPADWIPASISFTPTQSTVTVFWKTGTTANGFACGRSDNWAITPEPATFSLLLLGGLLLLRRRR